MFLGRHETIILSFEGKPLPEVPNVKADYKHDHIYVTWSKPESKYENLTYAVHFGTSIEELFEGNLKTFVED